MTERLKRAIARALEPCWVWVDRPPSRDRRRTMAECAIWLLLLITTAALLVILAIAAVAPLSSPPPWDDITDEIVKEELS